MEVFHVPSSIASGARNAEPKIVKSQFEELAETYEDMASWPFRRDVEIPSVLKILEDISGKDIFDFGCGTGMYSRWMKKRGANRVVGYDPTEGMIDYARLRANKEGLDLEFTSKLTPNLDNKFDLVLAVYVLPYASSSNELLTMCCDMARMLRPGGRLVTLPIHPDYETSVDYYKPYRINLISHDFHVDGSIVELHLSHNQGDAQVTAYYWSKKTLEETLSEAGFSSVQWKDLQISERVICEEDIEFLKNYLSNPHTMIMDCTLDLKVR